MFPLHKGLITHFCVTVKVVLTEIKAEWAWPASQLYVHFVYNFDTVVHCGATDFPVLWRTKL